MTPSAAPRLCPGCTEGAMCPACFAEHERRIYAGSLRHWLATFGSAQDPLVTARVPRLRLVRA